MKVAVERFWRIGRRSDPLHAEPKFQGAGRFDDPERLVGVLYGAPTLRTCLLEFLLPWPAAEGARQVLGAIPEPTTEDEIADASRDREIAETPRKVPPTLYERVAVHVRAVRTLTLTDLREISVRERIAKDPMMAVELRHHGFAHLDRGALLSPHRLLTQAVAGALLHGNVLDPGDGLYAESRHGGDMLCVFCGGAYIPQLMIVERMSLTPEHITLRELALELGLLY